MSLKIFLTAVAIVDDLAAVMVIALFYTAEVSTTALGVAGVAFVVLIGLNRAGFRSFLPYGVIGAVLWVAVLKSGVHATIAGVLIAMTIPASRLTGEDESPLEILEHAIHPWAAYLILPIFALANAGVVFGGDSSPETTAITLGIIAGLVVGKPIGVFAFSWLAVRLGVADLPEGARWSQVLGAGLLCGIGFTMSLFIGGLAFADPEQLNAAKVGILIASFAAGCAGALLLAMVGRGAEEA